VYQLALVPLLLLESFKRGCLSTYRREQIKMLVYYYRVIAQVAKIFKINSTCIPSLPVLLLILYGEFV